MLGSIGFPELILIFVVVLLIFGPKKLPEFAKFLGKAIREFKSTVDEAKSAIESEIEKVDLDSDLKTIDRQVKDTLNADDLYRDVTAVVRTEEKEIADSLKGESPAEKKTADGEEKSKPESDENQRQ
jgi:TatA/E family protein of Tat protein translocase